MIIAIGVATLVGAALLERFARGQIDAGLDARIIAVASGLSIAPDGRLVISDSVAKAPFEHPGEGWYWQASSGRDVIRSATLAGTTLTIPLDAPHPRRIEGDRPWPTDLRGPNGEALIARVSDRALGGEPLRVIATAPRAALTAPLRDMLAILVVSMAGLGTLLLGIVVVGVKFGLRPLTLLRVEVSDVRAGRANRVSLEGRPGEVAPLVHELNTLLDENEAGLERARRNVANLAHGLKTPLATLAVTLAEPGRDPDGVLAPLVGSMDRQIRHHLARARAASVGGPARARTDLAERLRELARVMAKVHLDHSVAFEFVGPDQLFAACEAQDLDELFVSDGVDAPRRHRCAKVAGVEAPLWGSVHERG